MYCRMAEQGKKESVLQMACSAVAKDLEVRKEKKARFCTNFFDRCIFFCKKLYYL